MRAEVEVVARTIRRRYNEPITLQELAASIYISPFHFLRVFQSATGLTPGRFLTAVRVFEAKKRLIETDLPVADIVFEVGYSSVGTFTSSFVAESGLTPTQYRDPKLRPRLLSLCPDYQMMPTIPSVTASESARQGNHRSGRLSVVISGDVLGVDYMLVCLFPDIVPQRPPVAASVAHEGHCVMEGAPVGSWHLFAFGLLSYPVPSQASMLVGRSQVRIGANEDVLAPIHVRPVALTDAPFLIPLETRPQTSKIIAPPNRAVS